MNKKEFILKKINISNIINTIGCNKIIKVLIINFINHKWLWRNWKVISKLSFYEIILKLIKSILEQDEEFKENSTHDSI